MLNNIKQIIFTKTLYEIKCNIFETIQYKKQQNEGSLISQNT